MVLSGRDDKRVQTIDGRKKFPHGLYATKR